MPQIVKPFQYNNGQLIDANQLDANLDTLYAAINGNLDGSNLKSGLSLDLNGIVSVKSPVYNASGSALATTGNMTSGSFILALISALDFVNGQGINVNGNIETASLQITAAATVSSNITVTLNGVTFLVAVLNGDTIAQVATKIRAATFTGWITGGVALSDTITFTSITSGVKTDAVYSAGTTTAAGTMTTTNQGTADLVTSVVSGAGTTTLILAASATSTVTGNPVTHEDTAALNAAIAAAHASGGTVLIPTGTYTINGVTSLTLYSNMTVLFGANVIIQASNVTGNTDYSIFSIINLSNVHIFGNGVIFKGGRSTHIINSGTVGESGQGINIKSSTQIRIYNVTSQDFWGDGVYIGTLGNTTVSTFIHLENVICDNNRRNALTIAGGQDIKVVDCVFKNSNGTAPTAGCDLEPNFSNLPDKRIVFSRCTFSGNGGPALLCDNANVFDVTVEDCIFDQPTSYALWFKGQGLNYFTNCRFRGLIINLSNIVFTACTGYQDDNYPAGYMLNLTIDAWLSFINCDFTIPSGVGNNNKFAFVNGSTVEETRKLFKGCKWHMDGNALADHSTVWAMSGYVSVEDCEILHTGANAVTGWQVDLSWVDGVRGRMLNTYFSPVAYSYFYGTSGYYNASMPHGIFAAAPVSDAWRKSQIVYNNNPASAGFIGWVCTTTGTACGTAWVASTAYVVGNIRFNGTKVYICTTSGTSAGSGGPTGTGTAIADGTAVWNYVDALAVFKTFGLIS